MQVTEHTLRDSIRLTVAELIESIKRESQKVLRAPGLRISTEALRNQMSVVDCEFTSAEFALRVRAIDFYYSDRPMALLDVHGPCFLWDTYGEKAHLLLNIFLLRHPAVVDALEEHLRMDATDLRKYVVEDYEAYLTQISAGGIPVRVEHFTEIGPNLRSAKSIWLNDCGGPRIRRVAIDTPLWHLREMGRFVDGTYHPLPDEVAEVIPEHIHQTMFPHLAVKPGNAGMIAYTQSPSTGVFDRQQVIKPGRFLKQHNPDLTDQQIKELSATCLGALAAGFHHSTSVEDYAQVYMNGPSSCMSYGPNDDDWCRLMVNGEFFHPCSVYAHPENDLEIVWLEVNERIVARAVVNKATKEYPRAYGSDSVTGSRERMERYLHSLGYVRRDEALAGQKVLKVRPDNYPEAIICPYIDCGNVGVHIRDDHMIIEPGGYQANHETGCLNSYDIDCEPDWHCECCGEGFSDDAHWERDQDDNRVCEDCACNVYTMCQVGGRTSRFVYVHENETIHTDRTPGREGGYVWMNGDSEHYCYVELSSSHYDYAVADADYCVYCPDEGEYILRSDAEQLGYVIDACNAYEIDSRAVLDGELVDHSDIDDDIHERVYGASNNYHPDLPVYITREEEEAA